MTLSIRIIDSPSGENISKWNCVFPPEGGRIGRRSDSTLVLNDSKRIVSGTHAEITLGANGYRITDLSTNGLYINRNTEPLGKNRSIGLNDGDVLGVGEYQLLVSISDVWGKADKSKPRTEVEKNSEEIETFDPFATAKVNLNEDNIEVKNPSASESPESLDFPDPFLNVKKAEEDPYITKDSYDFTEHQNTDVHLDPLDDILKDEMDFEIRRDPFSSRENRENHVKPRTPAPLSLDGRSMFGGNPFMNTNDLIDSPLGDISDSNNGFITMNIALRKQESQMEQAIDMALERLLKDLEPENFENMQAVFGGRKLFFLRPDYWKNYKKYFDMNQQKKEWHHRFLMYFRESLDILKNRKNSNGKTNNFMNEVQNHED